MIKKLVIALIVSTFAAGAIAATATYDGQFIKVAKHKKHKHPKAAK